MTYDILDGHPSRFMTTHWTVVLQASATGAEKTAALEQLCRSYWYPVYAYIRRQGNSPEDAQDLTQSFFAKLLHRDWLQGIEKREGRFSSWLLARVRTHITNEHRGVLAQKRGGGETPLPMEFAEAERWFGAEPQSKDTPERAFERRWALIVLDTAMRALRAYCREIGKESLFEHLNPFLTREPEEGEYAGLAPKLQMRKNSIAVAVHRLRQEYRNAVRAQVAAGLTDSERIQDEMRYLAQCLQN